MIFIPHKEHISEPPRPVTGIELLFIDIVSSFKSPNLVQLSNLLYDAAVFRPCKKIHVPLGQGSGGKLAWKLWRGDM
jgi:hypothetical protein